MIQVRKVIEHVYDKVMGQGSDAGSQTANNNAQDRGEDSEDLAAIAEEKVELLCNEQVNFDCRVTQYKQATSFGGFLREAFAWPSS